MPHLPFLIVWHGVRGTCRWKLDNRQSDGSFSELPIVPLEQAHRGGSVAQDHLQGGVVGDQTMDIVEFDIPDSGIGRTLSYARADHIPQRDMARSQHGDFRLPISRWLATPLFHDPPECIGRMTIVLVLFQ